MAWLFLSRNGLKMANGGRTSAHSHLNLYNAYRLAVDSFRANVYSTDFLYIYTRSTYRKPHLIA